MASNDLQQWLRDLQKKQHSQSEPQSTLGKFARNFVDAAVELTEMPPQRQERINSQQQERERLEAQNHAKRELKLRQAQAQAAAKAKQVKMKRKVLPQVVEAESPKSLLMKKKKIKHGKYARFLHAKPGHVRDAFVLSEILKPPVGLRNYHDF